VHAHAADLHLSINGAATKLKRALDSALGRLNDKNKREPLPLDPEVPVESYKGLTDNQ
jgi:ribosome-associated translation inhibitor RaiA